MTITKATATLIPKEVSIFFETPRKGQMPKKRLITKLLTSTPLIKMANRLSIGFAPPYIVNRRDNERQSYKAAGRQYHGNGFRHKGNFETEQGAGA